MSGLLLAGRLLPVSELLGAVDALPASAWTNCSTVAVFDHRDRSTQELIGATQRSTALRYHVAV